MGCSPTTAQTTVRTTVRTTARTTAQMMQTKTAGCWIGQRGIPVRFRMLHPECWSNLRYHHPQHGKHRNTESRGTAGRAGPHHRFLGCMSALSPGSFLRKKARSKSSFRSASLTSPPRLLRRSVCSTRMRSLSKSLWMRSVHDRYCRSCRRGHVHTPG